jgi:hypothetical protein
MQYFQELSDQDLEMVVGGSPVTNASAGVAPFTSGDGFAITGGNQSAGTAVFVTANASGGLHGNIVYGKTQSVTFSNGQESFSFASGYAFAFAF